jgi:tyrosyl-tRNA synthetase
MKSAHEQLELLCAGCETVVTREELLQRLQKGRPLRVKLGADPTAPDLHLGHSVVLRKLRQFQDFGHKAVFIVGDYTAQIGDPTGQNKTRPMLDANQIDQNAKTYFEQVGQILDTSPDKLEIRRNSEWLSKMSFADVIQLASQMTVARMMERDTFEKRYETDIPIGIHEFLYPLVQGHDSVMIHADVELGADQLFNNLVGREIQRAAGQDPQIVMILPILEGLDGLVKMSKSKGNYIGLTESPKEMFGKTMSISDELMARWYAVLLDRKPEGHPMEAKKALAHAIVARYHGPSAADQAQAEFEQQFSKKDYTEVAETLAVPGDIWIVELVAKTGKFRTRGDIRRLIQGGGVTVDGRKITDEKARITVRSGQVLKAGKLVVVKLQVS